MEVDQFLQLALLDGLIEHLSYAQMEALLHDFVINEGSDSDYDCLVGDSVIYLTNYLRVSRLDGEAIAVALLLLNVTLGA